VPVPQEMPGKRKLGAWEGLGIELPSDEEWAEMKRETAELFYGPEDEWPPEWQEQGAE
jgi:hypothetical protein